MDTVLSLDELVELDARDGLTINRASDQKQEKQQLLLYVKV